MLAPSVVAAVDLALAYQACSKSGAPVVPGTRSDLCRAFEQSMKVGTLPNLRPTAANIGPLQFSLGAVATADGPHGSIAPSYMNMRHLDVNQ